MPVAPVAIAGLSLMVLLALVEIAKRLIRRDAYARVASLDTEDHVTVLVARLPPKSFRLD